eukprot:3610822-Rhodomonas_salina.1
MPERVLAMKRRRPSSPTPSTTTKSAAKNSSVSHSTACSASWQWCMSNATSSLGTAPREPHSPPAEQTLCTLHTAPHCTTLHHTAPHCTTLHHTALKAEMNNHKHAHASEAGGMVQRMTVSARAQTRWRARDHKTALWDTAWPTRATKVLVLAAEVEAGRTTRPP